MDSIKSMEWVDYYKLNDLLILGMDKYGINEIILTSIREINPLLLLPEVGRRLNHSVPWIINLMSLNNMLTFYRLFLILNYFRDQDN